MNLELAFEHALNGHAILFTGAGFSMDAINLRGKKIKNGSQFAKYISDKTGIDPNTPLTIAAEEYQLKFGEESLIEEIQNEFSVKQIHESHSILASIPWRQIYTTNYDNVMETAYAQAGKKLVAVTSEIEVSEIPKKSTLCIHLNGYVDQLKYKSLDGELKLTEFSYVSSSITSSAWATQFRDDLRVAKAVFFVGYSLADIDVQKILFESQILSDKCIFIVGENPTQTTIQRASKFGQIYKINTSDFANKLQAFQQTYTPPEKLDFLGECIKKYELRKNINTIQDKDVFDLMLYGRYSSELISSSISSHSPYYRERSLAKNIIDLLDSGERAIVVHSELGNGKTLFIEGVKLIAVQRGYDVYSVENRTRELLSEIQYLTSSSNKVLLVFENYFDYYDAIKYFLNNASKKSAVILSARTSIHEVTSDDLYGYIKTNQIPQVNVDKLDHDDIQWIAKLFDQYGLWAEKASFSKKQKIEILNRHPSFSATLLGLLRSQTIITRFDQLLKQLNEQREYYQVIISILVLSVLNYQTSIDKLIDIWGEIILNPKFKKDPVISQIIEFEHGDAILRSSTLARYLLKLVVDGKIVVDTLIHMRRVSEEKIKSSDYFKTLAKNLVRFHNLYNLIPESNKKTSVLYYYESIKNLPSSKEHPLFWLQYGVACLVLKEFDRTEKYLSTAYAYARETPNFDVVQIDNHYARFLLEKSIEYPNDANYMAAFRKAKSIIDGQIIKEALHFPYKVAKLYADFYLAHEAHLSKAEKQEIVEVANSVMTRISRLPTDKQKQDHIIECQSSMHTIFERTAGYK